MPLDTRIALSGNNPLDTQAKLMTLAELSDQQQARGLQMQQTRDNMQRQQQLRGLLGGLAPDTTDDGRVGALRNAGYFDEADKLYKHAAMEYAKKLAVLRRECTPVQLW